MTHDIHKSERDKPGRQFDVQVGFARITVSSDSISAAIAEARRQLSRDLPGLWDIIFNLEDSRFVVAAID